MSPRSPRALAACLSAIAFWIAISTSFGQSTAPNPEQTQPDAKTNEPPDPDRDTKPEGTDSEAERLVLNDEVIPPPQIPDGLDRLARTDASPGGLVIPPPMIPTPQKSIIPPPKIPQDVIPPPIIPQDIIPPPMIPRQIPAPKPPYGVMPPPATPKPGQISGVPGELVRPDRDPSVVEEPGESQPTTPEPSDTGTGADVFDGTAGLGDGTGTSPLADPSQGGFDDFGDFGGGDGAGGLGTGFAPTETGSTIPNMMGDMGPLLVGLPLVQTENGSPGIPTSPTPPEIPNVPQGPPVPPLPPGVDDGPPLPPDPRQPALFATALRSLKVTENQNPRPQDRLLFSFNYFNNVNDDLNRRLFVPIDAIQLYRYIWNLEKTFNDGNGSLGIRLPLYTLSSSSRFAGFGGTFTSLGNLNVYGKHIFAQDPETGSLVSGGLSLDIPTGPDQIADAPFLASLNTLRIQPFFGYSLVRDRFYLQGFSAFEFPVDPTDVTMMYNDVAVGYVVYRDQNRSSMITALAPQFEVHVNTPLNRRDEFDPSLIAGTPDIVNLTTGLNVEFYGQIVLSGGVVVPVTATEPFDIEAFLQVNWLFGRTAELPFANRAPFGGL